MGRQGAGASGGGRVSALRDRVEDLETGGGSPPRERRRGLSGGWGCEPLAGVSGRQRPVVCEGPRAGPLCQGRGEAAARAEGRPPAPTPEREQGS